MNSGILLDFFNNASTAAFLGAAFAYLLVQLTDRRRLRRKRDLLYKVLQVNHDHCEGKIVAVTNNKGLLIVTNTVLPAPFLRFGVDDVKALKMDVLDQLTSTEIRALDGICYTMTEVDNILTLVYDLASAVYKVVTEDGPEEEQKATAKKLLTEYNSALVNLRRLKQMLELFVAGKAETVVTKEYSAREFQD